jgi:hypothetical protein
VSKTFYFIGNFCFFAVPIFIVLAVCIFSIWVSVIFGTNDPELVDRVVLIRQIQFRDFRQLAPAMLVRFTDRVEFEFGLCAKQRLRFKFSPFERYIILRYQNPNPAQLPMPTEQLSRCERNLQIIAKVRYLQWMTAVKNAAESERDAIMERIVLELKYWDVVYREFLTAVGLPQPTLQEALLQMEHLINEFKKNESIEHVVEIEKFKQQIIRTFTQYEIKKNLENITNTIDLLFKPAQDNKQKKR